MLYTSEHICLLAVRMAWYSIIFAIFENGHVATDQVHCKVFIFKITGTLKIIFFTKFSWFWLAWNRKYKIWFYQADRRNLFVILFAFIVFPSLLPSFIDRLIDKLASSSYLARQQRYGGQIICCVGVGANNNLTFLAALWSTGWKNLV